MPRETGWMHLIPIIFAGWVLIAWVTDKIGGLTDEFTDNPLNNSIGYIQWIEIYLLDRCRLLHVKSLILFLFTSF